MSTAEEISQRKADLISQLTDYEIGKLTDRFGHFRIDDWELSGPYRIINTERGKTLVLGPLASECQNCRGKSKTLPGCEPKNEIEKEAHEFMDSMFIGMRHGSLCERRIYLA